MKDDKLERRGEYVFVTYKGKTLVAMATLVSENGVSAIIMFDGMLGGYLGMMPILFDEGRYIDLIEHLPLTMTPYPSVTDKTVDAFLANQPPPDPARVARIRALFDAKLKKPED